MMYGRYVNNVYSDANCNDSKTEKVMKTVFALKKKKFTKKFDLPKTRIDFGTLRLLTSPHINCATATHTC